MRTKGVQGDGARSKQYAVFVHVSSHMPAYSQIIRCVADIRALLEYYAASRGICLPLFRSNVSVQSSRVKNPRRK
jgi:hypothetical protein